MKHKQAIYARVRKADYRFDPRWLCLLCGHKWTICDHSANDNIKMVNQVKADDGLD